MHCCSAKQSTMSTPSNTSSYESPKQRTVSTRSNTGSDDMKRIPMACTRCRNMKLRCRVPDGDSRCSRCISQKKDCQFVPVSSEQTPMPNPSAPYSQGHFRLQPIAPSTQLPMSTQLQWNDAYTSALYPNYVAHGHGPSYDYTHTRYQGHYNEQQSQLGTHTGTAIPMQMDYPNQDMFSNGQMSTTVAQVNLEFDPTISQYVQSTPNGATWPHAMTMYTAMPEEPEYYAFYNPQGQTH
ncbi:hypothetical protein JR316_0005027 [Psilocybe cubensis]|uniref:Zn(2)-C6 fungal-type domain-containing protein n=2 Tax=Psilocybe cubensis TaxID=181762 RepID=A0A8H7Y1H1_PSICU|nr:hypothetical protein JR316_0005027 [Psilocybe cubensis]KAH9482927.1 hypothetical protein JR316_0005027 [Psilocybe cubensis]